MQSNSSFPLDQRLCILLSEFGSSSSLFCFSCESSNHFSQVHPHSLILHYPQTARVSSLVQAYSHANSMSTLFFHCVHRAARFSSICPSTSLHVTPVSNSRSIYPTKPHLKSNTLGFRTPLPGEDLRVFIST